MTGVVKRSKSSSLDDLRKQLLSLIHLLEEQNEDAAVSDLRIALSDLQKYTPDSNESAAALALLLEAFEGEHELIAYTYKREKQEAGQWTDIDRLYLASTGVLTLVKRLMR